MEPLIALSLSLSLSLHFDEKKIEQFEFGGSPRSALYVSLIEYQLSRIVCEIKSGF